MAQKQVGIASLRTESSMANVDPVEEFLNQEVDQGIIDSTGVFTIDPALAWEKANTYNLPFYGAWVLKLVQFSALTDCSVLQVQQARNTTTFQFRFQDPQTWNFESLKVALFDFGAKSPPGLGCLAEAILFLTKKLEHSLTLAFEEEVLFRWDGENVQFTSQQLPNFALMSLEVSHVPWYEKKAIENLISRPGKPFSVDISNALTQYCYVSPVPIHLDSRLIAGLHNDPKFSPSEGTRPFALLHCEPAPGLETLRGDLLHPWTDPHFSRYLSVSLPSGWSEPPRDAYSLLVLCCAYVRPLRLKMTAFDKGQTKTHTLGDGPSTLVWVQDGVIVGRETLLGRNDRVGFLVVAGAQGLPTDVTGLQLIETKDRAKKKSTVLKQFANILKRRRAELQGLELTGMGTEQVNMLKVQSGFTLITVFPIGCVLAYSTWQLQKKLEVLEQELQADVRRHLAEFESNLHSDYNVS